MTNPSLNPPARSGEQTSDDETGPLSVDEREALVDWITRHRAEAGAAWASRLLAAYDAAYDAVATRSPAASLGEPAERPTLTENIVYTKIESSSARVSEGALGAEPFSEADCEILPANLSRGGQHVRTPPTITVRHKPTGIGVTVDAHRSQFQNKQAAMAKLRALTALRADRDRLLAEMRELRESWWLSHGCSFGALYGDDGEMHCASCLADFKRLSGRDIAARLRNAAMLRRSPSSATLEKP